MYDYCSTEEERNWFVNQEDEAGTNEDDDDDDDVAYPFELRTGLTMLRWINYTLRKVTGCTNETDNGLSNMPEGSETYISNYNQLKMKHLYSLALRIMPNEMARATSTKKSTT